MKIKILILQVSLWGGLPQYCFAFCVKGAKANLRTAPKANAPISWTAGKFMPLIRIGQKQSWFQVMDLDGEKHWIYSSLLTKSFQCLVVKTSKVNIRIGPGSQYPQAEYRSAQKYESFKRLGKKGPWYEVINDIGQKGWVHSSAVWLPISRLKINY